MACTNPDDCEEDVLQLERIGDAMEHSSKTFHSDLKPFMKTIKALNKVSRTIQDSRRSRELGSPDGQPGGSSGTQQQLNNHTNSLAVSDLDTLAFDTIPDFPMTLDGDPDPLGFVRAMENDFIGRNWNENWWDMGGGVNGNMENGMTFLPERSAARERLLLEVSLANTNSAGPGQQQAGYSMPTPNT